MYIRTKDGVYEVTDILEDGSCWCLNNGGKYFRKSDIIKQSESLEELCDEYVMEDNSDNKPYRPFIIYGRSLEELNERQNCNESLYGAIWTSKGLIYVAKMDNEGKLVLI